MKSTDAVKLYSFSASVCLSVCVERVGEREGGERVSQGVCACVCVCGRERENGKETVRTTL